MLSSVWLAHAASSQGVLQASCHCHFSHGSAKVRMPLGSLDVPCALPTLYAIVRLKPAPETWENQGSLLQILLLPNRLQNHSSASLRFLLPGQSPGADESHPLPRAPSSQCPYDSSLQICLFCPILASYIFPSNLIFYSSYYY